MRKLLCAMLLLTSVSMAAQQSQKQLYEEYIATWRDLAENQQVEYGIPASITLAQGLLESAGGTSELAINANNHFGIKCTSDWMGATYTYDDDQKGECFRKYADAGQSFVDHAKFLLRDRYRTCFEIPVTDYAEWARRLKTCGYATDPAYPAKLIRIIEEYGLASGAEKTKLEKFEIDAISSVPVLGQQTVGHSETDFYNTPEPLTASKEKTLFFIHHKKEKQNGVSYVKALEGDTYANVAFRLNVRERDLRVWNDALGRELKVDDFIYLGSKASQSKDKRKTYYWVHPGESVWLIAQREGVKVDAIRKLNGWGKDVNVFKTRQKILLRKVKE